MRVLVIVSLFGFLAIASAQLNLNRPLLSIRPGKISVLGSDASNTNDKSLLSVKLANKLKSGISANVGRNLVKVDIGQSDASAAVGINQDSLVKLRLPNFLNDMVDNIKTRISGDNVDVAVGQPDSLVSVDIGDIGNPVANDEIEQPVEEEPIEEEPVEEEPVDGEETENPDNEVEEPSDPDTEIEEPAQPERPGHHWHGHRGHRGRWGHGRRGRGQRGHGRRGFGQRGHGRRGHGRRDYGRRDYGRRGQDRGSHGRRGYYRNSNGTMY